MNMKNWQDFLEAKGDTPPQGKGANSYYAPNTKNSDKTKLRVAEKDNAPLGSEASPPFKDPKAAQPLGEKPDYSALTTEDFLKETREMSTGEFILHVFSKKK